MQKGILVVMPIKMDYPARRGYDDSFGPSDAYNSSYKNEKYRIYVPCETYADNGAEVVRLAEHETAKMSETIFLLLDKIDETFGGERLNCRGSLVNPIKVNNHATFLSHNAVNIALRKIQSALNNSNKGITTGEKLQIRNLQKSTPFSSLFSIRADIGVVLGFTGKASPIRAGLKLYHPELVDKFDNGLESFREPSIAENLSLSDMVVALDDTQKLSALNLEKGGVEATPLAIHNYLEYFHMKKLKVVKDSLAAMPYLDRGNSDETIVNLVGKGLSYEKLMALYITDNFPDEEEVLNAFGEMPFTWMMKILV